MKHIIKVKSFIAMHWVIGALKRDQSESLGSFQNILENFQTALTEGQKGQSESFQMAWKVSILAGEFSDGLESFQMVWKLPRWSRQFPIGLGSFQMA